MNSIYSSEDKLEEQMKQAQERLIEQEKAIAKRKKEVDELENPKDESLDNKIVVWASVAFGNRDSVEGQPQPIVACHSLAT